VCLCVCVCVSNEAWQLIEFRNCDRLISAATLCNTLQHTAAQCNTLLIESTHRSRPNSRYNILQHTATYCNTLQHTATHCNTLQHTATNVYTHTVCVNMYQYYWPPVTYRKSSPVTICISILLAVTIYISILFATKYRNSSIYISIILALIDYWPSVTCTKVSLTRSTNICVICIYVDI